MPADRSSHTPYKDEPWLQDKSRELYSMKLSGYVPSSVNYLAVFITRFYADLPELVDYQADEATLFSLSLDLAEQAWCEDTDADSMISAHYQKQAALRRQAPKQSPLTVVATTSPTETETIPAETLYVGQVTYADGKTEVFSHQASKPAISA